MDSFVVTVFVIIFFLDVAATTAPSSAAAHIPVDVELLVAVPGGNLMMSTGVETAASVAVAPHPNVPLDDVVANDAEVVGVGHADAAVVISALLVDAAVAGLTDGNDNGHASTVMDASGCGVTVPGRILSLVLEQHYGWLRPK